MSKLKRRRARAAKPRESVSPEISRAAMTHGSFIPEPAEIAGQFVAVKREGAHRRLARERRIDGDEERAVMQYVDDVEAAAGAVQYEGDGGGDGSIITSRMLARDRVRLADERMGSEGRLLVVAACVLCWRAEDLAMRLLGAELPDSSGLTTTYLRSPKAAHEDLDRAMDAFRRRAQRLVDKRLVPAIRRLAGTDRRHHENQGVDETSGSMPEEGSLQDVALNAVDQESP